MNNESTQAQLSNEEEELQALLERVLGATTTQPIRDEISKLREYINENLDEIAGNVKGLNRRMENHGRDLRKLTEDCRSLDENVKESKSELVALNQNLIARVDKLSASQLEIASQVKGQNDKLFSGMNDGFIVLNGISHESINRIEAFSNRQAGLVTQIEAQHDKLFSGMEGGFITLKEAQSRSDIALIERITAIENSQIMREASINRKWYWLIGIQTATILTTIAVLVQMLGWPRG